MLCKDNNNNISSHPHSFIVIIIMQLQKFIHYEILTQEYWENKVMLKLQVHFVHLESKSFRPENQTNATSYQFFFLYFYYSC